ncbi:MAG: 50S ribosomal protein L2 [Candidatus Pacebacteria bacterium CG1_02_43_31]|nr:MAG: 50S ribosomal protein L2 [Candidatus Pacebacteria bacterium CG1_02_43_31]
MLITQKPTSSGRRHQINIDRSELHKGKPEKSLLESGHKKRQGRGFLGHITVRHRGAGVKKKLRIIDWKRKNRDIEGTVIRLEYDPMRSSHLALIYYKDGSKGYILAPQGLAAGDIILAGEKAEVKVGNALPLKNIPIGMFIHNLEIRAGKGAQMVRGAGTAAIIQSKEGKYVTIQLPSKELRLLNAECYATIGQIGNQDWKNRKIGKAGRKRLMGIRPTVRGTAQHPDSHPHGGGEGRSGVGMKYPKTPWGKHALGKKTRKKNHRTNKWIIRDRRVK